MIKVMIADDEYFVREGIRRTVDWERYGCTLCSEAQNGCEGLEIARRERPDLVISDIKMPGIDGLSMAREIRTFLPECRFIFITGYDEFELAKNAVKLSACDFLLKPINEDEFLGAIQRAAKECVKSDVIIDIARERVLLNMMRGNQFELPAYENMAEELRDNYITLDELLVVLLENDSYPDLVDSGNLTAVHRQSSGVRQLARSLFPACYTVECHPDRIAMLIPADALHTARDIDERLRYFLQNAKDLFSVALTMGVSAINYIDNIHECYEQSKYALKSKLYHGSGSVLYFEEVSKASAVPNREFILKEEKELLLRIQACDRAATQKQLRQIYDRLGDESNVDDSVIKQITIEIMLNSLGLLSARNISPETVFGGNLDVYKTVAKLSTILDLYSWVQQSVDQIIEVMRERSGNQDLSTEEALCYIREHFTEQLSLSQISDKVYLSESYLSRRIKKALGMTFVEYVTKLRMEKALEYLSAPNPVIGEIATQLGYSDYRYFSGCFKRYTGYSPSEFVKKKG
ncbi:MAG: response regulator [Angelakisella sp.]